MPRKKAVLIGINYYGTDSELGGSLNDVAKIKEFLVEDRGWPDDPDSMYLLTDEPDNEGTEYWPNMENIKAAFQWLVEGNEDGDACWLSYGGHGGEEISVFPLLLLILSVLLGWERYISAGRIQKICRGLKGCQSWLTCLATGQAEDLEGERESG